MKQLLSFLFMISVMSIGYGQILTENFSSVTNNTDISLIGWTNFAEDGTHVFQGKYYATEDNYYAQMSAYNSGETNNAAWLVTPTLYLSPGNILNFRSKSGYTNADVFSLWISTDFSGNITAATWTELTFNEPTDNGSSYGEWFNSGGIDLESYAGSNINIAFKYTGGDPDATTTWQIDDIKISKKPQVDITPTSITATIEAGTTNTTTLTIKNVGGGTLSFTNEMKSFTKSDWADWTLEENQLRLTNDVWITRADAAGLFNIAQEPSYGFTSPTNTEWVKGLTNEVEPGDYDIWRDAVDNNPSEAVGENLSMHIIGTDYYYDMIFTSWTQGNMGMPAGGGFSVDYRLAMAPWINLSAESGEINSAEQQNITVTLDATNLSKGTYYSQIAFSTNDENNEILVIPVELNVTGEPEIDIQTTNIDYGDVFINGEKEFKLEIVNIGRDTLYINNISTDEVAFHPESSSFFILSQDTVEVNIYFNPTANQAYSGILTIESNDTNENPTTINLTGNGIGAPEINVDPTEIFETNYLCDEIKTANLNISNTGLNDLDWEIVHLQDADIQTTMNAGNGHNGNMFDITAIKDIYINSFDVNAQTTSPVTIEIYYKEGTYVGSETAAEDWTLLGSQTVTGNGEGSYTNIDPGQILHIPTGSTYGIYVTTTGGINLSYTNGANTYSDENLTITTGVGNAYPFMDTFTPRTWNGKINYSYKSDYLNASPTSGTVSQNSSATASVDLDATGLISGIYNDSIFIVSNDPLNPVIPMFIAIEVIGEADIQVSENILNYGSTTLESQKELQFIISNQGCDTLEIDNILNPEPAFTYIPAIPFNILPNESEIVTVTFTPTTETTYTSTLSINNNDELQIVELHGEGVGNPEITVSPDTSYLMVNGCDIIDSIPVLIGNTAGLGALNFEIVQADTLKESSSITFTNTGETTTHIFNNLPVALRELELTVTINGDYDGSTEYADLYIEGDLIETIPDGDVSNGTNIIKTYAFSRSEIKDWINNGELIIKIVNSIEVNPSMEGTDLNKIEVSGLYDKNIHSGTIAAGQNSIVEVQVNATDLSSGEHAINYYIMSNDTINPIVPFVCMLTINGAPEIYAPSAIDFGEILARTDSTSIAYIKNYGCDTLIITDINSSLPEYTTNDTAFELLPYDSVQLLVTFTPTTMSTFTGSLIVTNNDIEQTILLSGIGLGSPEMVITPDTVFAAITNCNGTTTETVTIENTGDSTLYWNIQQNMVINGGFETSNYNPWTLNPVHTATVVNTDPAVGGFCLSLSGGNIGAYNGLKQTFAQATPKTISLYIKPTNTAPHGLFAVGDETTSSNGGMMFPYFDGINLQINGFNFPYTPDQWHFLEYKNIDFNNHTFDFYMNGVLMQSSMSFDYNCDYISEAHIFNGFPATSYFDDINIGGTSDLLSFSSESGTVNAGTTSDLQVQIDGTDLLSGSYEEKFFIASNDPINDAIEIPVIFDVVGSPEIALSNTNVNFGDVIIGNNEIEHITINNNGCDTLYITDIVSSIPECAIDQTSFYILPYELDVIQLTFDPLAVQVYSGDITIINNDIEQIIPITGNCTGAPEITVDPTNFNITANGCDIIQTAPLTIYNTTGNIPLEYEIEMSSEIVASGTVDVGGSVVENITFDATGLNSGTYNLEFYVNSNDPANPVITVPYDLTVNGAPEINLSASILNFGEVYSGSGTFNMNLEIENTGCDVLEVTDIASSLLEFYPDQTAFTILPGNSTTVVLTFEPLINETYTSTLTITNNDVEQIVELHGKGVTAGTPLIQITENQMSFGDEYLGETSNEQVYYVSGSSLTENIEMSVPFGFQISTTSLTGFGNAITLIQSAGTVNSTPIYVRFAPTSFQTYNETVIHTSAGAIQKDLMLTGNGIVPPEISTTKSELAFGDIWDGFESTEQTYKVSGSGLSEDLIINAPTDFVISTTSGSGYTSSLNFTPTSGIVPTTDIFVKFTPNTPGIYLADIEQISNGTPTETVEVSGTSLENYVATFYVTDGTNPIDGATVIVDGNTQTTDGGGLASINLLPGTYTYNVTHTNYDSYVESIEIIDQNVTKNVNLSLTVYDVTFNVTNGTDPMDGAIITLTGYGTQTTESTGTVTFTDVLPENGITYTITASDYDDATGSIDVINSDVTENITMVLTKYDVTFNVTDGTSPINGATISFTGYGTQTTNATGAATFADVVPESGIAYIVTANAYNDATGNIDVTDINVSENVTMSLTPYEVVFNVTDGTDPISGATVALTGYGTATTDGTGTATFASVLPENGITYTVSATTYDDATGTIDVIAENVNENVTMNLTTYDVAFIVTDGRGVIENATITLAGYGIVTTDATGLATFTDVLPENGIAYTVTAAAYDDVSGTLNLLDGNISEPVTMTLTTYEVAFNVTDGIDPIAGANITLIGYGTIVTDAAGLATFADVLPENGVAYTVSATTYNDATGTVDVINGNISEDVTMILSTYEVVFNVTDGTNPIEGATVILNGYGTATTNATGVATFTNILPENGITYTVSATGYDDATETVDVVSNNITENVVLNLTSYEVLFTVSNGTNPIEGATITVNSTDLITDMNGEAVINMVNGDYPYAVSATGFENATGSVSISGTNTTETVELTPVYTIAFTVTANGNLANGASITINNEVLTTDASGIAAIELADGSYPYTVSLDGYENISETVVVDGANVDVPVNFVGLGNDLNITCKIYPNPSSGTFTIDLPGTFDVTVFNEAGNMIYKVKAMKEQQIELPDISDGLYLVKIQTGKSTITKQLIIKQ